MFEYIQNLFRKQENRKPVDLNPYYTGQLVYVHTSILNQNVKNERNKGKKSELVEVLIVDVIEEEYIVIQNPYTNSAQTISPDLIVSS